MVNTEMGMTDIDHHGGPSTAYTAGKGWAEKFVSVFWGHLVWIYQGIDG